MSRLLVAANVADLYEKPSSSSERVTQAVFGEPVEVVREEGDGFCLVGTPDRYEGWIHRDRLAPPWHDSDHLSTTIATLFAEVYSEPDAQSEMVTKLVVGTRVAIARAPEVGDWTPLMLPAAGQIGYIHRACLNVHYEGERAVGAPAQASEARRNASVAMRRRIVETIGSQATRVGRRLIGTPYLWGGTTPFGIDCSGFVQLSYKLSGIALLRDAGLQKNDRRFESVEVGAGLADAALADGDLVFFRKKADGPITHVGMGLGDGRFVHSSGGVGVHIDPCAHPRYTATYAGAARLSADADYTINTA